MAQDEAVMTLSFRPTSSLRARGRADRGADTVDVNGSTDAELDVSGRYFKMLNTRRTYTIEQLLGVRNKFVAPPRDLGDFPCVESGADDMLTWGLSSNTKLLSKSKKGQRRNGDSGRGGSDNRGSRGSEEKGATSPSGGEDVVPLTQSENRWRRTTEDGFITVLRKLKGVLNKLTVDKFDSLAARFVEITATSCRNEEDLRSAVQLVFDKALAETNFGDMYPNLCVLLSQKLPAITVKSEDMTHPPRSVTFKSVILALCQHEFEKAFRAIKPVANIAEDELEELRVKQRLRMLGNMQFIGELYKKSMLNSKVVLYCANQLSSSEPPNSSHLESICTLLSTVGKSLDEGARAPRPLVDMKILNALFDRLRTLSTANTVPLRTRFLIRDILDLRDSQWVPRRKKVEAMKIDEFRKKEDPRQRAARDAPRAEFFGMGQHVSREAQSASSRRSRGNRRKDRYARVGSHKPVLKPVSDMDLAARYETVTPASTAQKTEEPEVSDVPGQADIPKISEKEICRRVASIVREYIGIVDIKEAVECLDEINQNDNSLRCRQVCLSI